MTGQEEEQPYDPLERFERRLSSLRKHNLDRTTVTLESPQTPVITVEGTEYLCFASNNYLGLADHSDLKRGARKAVEAFGTGSGAARLITGNFSIHERAEANIADLKRTEESLLFSSGYAANMGTLRALGGKATTMYYDELNHASLIDGVRLSESPHHAYKHGNVDHLRSLLSDTGENTRHRLIVTDGVFSMDGDLAPLPGIVDLARAFDALLMVDDAHGTGVIGEKGRGIVNFFDLDPEDVPVQMGTLSKAMGVQGGFIAGKEALISFLRNRARSFVYSTAPSPAIAGAVCEGVQKSMEMDEKRAHLHSLAATLHEELDEAGFELTPSDVSTPITGLLLGDIETARTFSEQLRQKGIFIPAIRPPTVPRGSSRLRVSVMASHTRSQLQEAIDAIIATGRSLHVI